MKTNSKDTLCDAIRAIKAQLVKTPEDEARFRAEAKTSLFAKLWRTPGLYARN